MITDAFNKKLSITVLARHNLCKEECPFMSQKNVYKCDRNTSVIKLQVSNTVRRST